MNLAHVRVDRGAAEDGGDVVRFDFEARAHRADGRRSSTA